MGSPENLNPSSYGNHPRQTDPKGPSTQQTDTLPRPETSRRPIVPTLNSVCGAYFGLIWGLRNLNPRTVMLRLIGLWGNSGLMLSFGLRQNGHANVPKLFLLLWLRGDYCGFEL